MQIRFSYHNFEGKECKPQLEEYANEKKLNSLVRLLKPSDVASSDLYVRAEYFTRHNSFAVLLNLEIAKHVLVAKEASHDLTKAFDSSLAKIIYQLRKLESKEQIKPLRIGAKIKNHKS